MDSAAQDRTSIKIGYTVSKTGPNAPGAGLTTIPNYELWVKEVNERGGLELPDGRRLPIEVIEYDDRSSAEEVVRNVERLATQDEVDFILPPWGTGFHLAVAPLFGRYGYPLLSVTAITDKAPELAQRFPNTFWFIGGGSDYTAAVAETLAAARNEGKINNQIAMISVADGFGIDLVTAARPDLTEAGFEIVYDEVYPLGTTDFATYINEAKATGADSFLAWSYPPDTFALTGQAQVASYNPDVFLLGVGVGFPPYQAQFGPNVEGVMSLGGLNYLSPENVAYRERFEAMHGRPADLWGSVIVYSSLQILEEAIRRVGLDREAVVEEIANGTFDTAMGQVKFVDNQVRDNIWWVGQWQNGRFVGVEPDGMPGAHTVKLPKPAWQASQ